MDPVKLIFILGVIVLFLIVVFVYILWTLSDLKLVLEAHDERISRKASESVVETERDWRRTFEKQFNALCRHLEVKVVRDDRPGYRVEPTLSGRITNVE